MTAASACRPCGTEPREGARFCDACGSTVPADEGLAIRDFWLPRLWALLVRAREGAPAYTDLTDRYREIANSLGFEGHIDRAKAKA